MAQGFIVNDLGGLSGVEAAIGASYSTSKYVLLHEDSTIDPRSRAVPQGAYLSHLELSLTTASGTPATVDCFLSYDSGGDDHLTSEIEDVDLQPGVTTATLQSCVIAIAQYCTMPTDQTTKGALYLWLKVNTGTVNCTRARLHWHDKG